MNYLGIYDPIHTPPEILTILPKESIQIITISTGILLTITLILIFWDIFSEPKQSKH
jgi:hypothetical protein